MKNSGVFFNAFPAIAGGEEIKFSAEAGVEAFILPIQ